MRWSFVTTVRKSPAIPLSFCSACRDYSFPLVLINSCFLVAELPAPRPSLFYVSNNKAVEQVPVFVVTVSLYAQQMSAAYMLPVFIK